MSRLPGNDDVATVLAFAGAFTRAECSRIIAMRGELADAEVGVYPEPSRPTRAASTRLVPGVGETAWVRERLARYVADANRRLRVELEDLITPILCVTYPVGGFFDWHTDLANGAESTRKVSLSVLLNDASEFEGGGLQFASHEDPLPRLEAGTLVAFPSHLAHRVLPVSRGDRHALVAWAHGPSFR